MNFLDVQKDIVSKTPKNIYIFYGEEYTVLNMYIDKLKTLFDNVYSCDSHIIVKNKLFGKSLLQTGKDLYIIRDDKDFQNAESLWDMFDEKTKKRDIYIIFKYSSVDQRSKFAKRFSDVSVEFEKLQPDILKKHIKKSVDISDKACDYLISICHSDYGRILLEIDKIKNSAEFYKLSHDNAFKMCYNDKAFYEEPEDVVYDLIDSILTRNSKLVYDLLKESVRRGDNPIMILSLLHTNVKAVLQVKSFGNKKNVSDATGLTPFQCKNALKYVNRYTLDELCTFIKFIKYVDNSIKNGTINSDMAIDYLLMNVL